MSTKKKTSPEEKTEILVLDAFQETKKQLTTFISDYTKLVVTEENLEDGKKALFLIREKRCSIQNQRKENDKSRIAWNKKFASSNEAKETELISVLSPVEEAIAQQVKAIEDIKQAEKDKKAAALQEIYNARLKQITDTGATISEGGYLLEDQFISHDEIKRLPDAAFEKCVFIFEQTKLCIEEEQEERLRLLTRTSSRRKVLFEIGMAAGEVAFNYLNNPDIKPFTFVDIETISDEKFDLRLENYKSAIANLKAIAEKEKAAADQAAAEIAAQKLKNEEATAALEKEREELAAQKKQMAEEKLKARKTQLFALGLALNGNNFVFHEIEVWMENLTDLNDIEWNNCLANITDQVITVKTRIEEEAAKEKEKAAADILEKEASEKRRKEALLPDKEKLIEFANTFNKPFILDLTTEEGKKILSDFNLKVINSVQELIIELNNNLK